MTSVRKLLCEFLSDKVDDFGFADPHLLCDGKRSPFNLLNNVTCVIVHLTSLERIKKEYTSGGWFVNRFTHVKNVNNQLITFILENGGKFFPIPPYTYERETFTGPLSFKYAGYLSGLGFIGKNHLLIHPQFGPRIVLGVVLTDWPVPSQNTTQKGYNPCESCTICVESCPLDLLSKPTFDRCACYSAKHLVGRPCHFTCMTECPVGLDNVTI